MNARALGLVCALGTLCSARWDAQAAQVNSPGTIFHSDDVSGGNVRYLDTMVINWGPGTINLFAPIPRVPGGGSVVVFVDGAGVVGTYGCSVTSRGFATRSFSVTAPSGWTRAVSFTAAEAPSSAYITVRCSLPLDGALIGVTIIG
jgi:hypothetical protein